MKCKVFRLPEKLGEIRLKLCTPALGKNIQIFPSSKQKNVPPPNLAVGRFIDYFVVKLMGYRDQLGEYGFDNVLGERPTQHSKQCAGPDL